jgi:HD superfamily phosphohydrolase
MPPKTQRIRDPVHDIIAFDERNELDQVAWNLLNTDEVQRLRRIKQIGGAEFVYPGATHTRFSHSVGVFHNARRLLTVAAREIELRRAPGKYLTDRAEVALLAALLHDIGHGPLSHSFEEAQRSIEIHRSSFKFAGHEEWSARLIMNPKGKIFEILEARRVGLAKEIAEMIRKRTPADMYEAIVGSSFDADRLDYIQRDRYMTGTGVGAIDLGWLVDNFRVARPPGRPKVHSFCLLYKAREAAEDFLLARLRLYTNVYFHKTSRGFEQMFRAIFQAISEAVSQNKAAEIGLDPAGPLSRFFSNRGQIIENYKNLDDTVIWGALPHLKSPSDPRLSELPRRILNRKRLDVIDVQSFFLGKSESQGDADEVLREKFRADLNKTVFRDEKWLTLYGTDREDKPHKRVMIQLRDKKEPLKEITDFPDSMIKKDVERHFLRYYFLRSEDYSKATKLLDKSVRKH